MAESSKPTHSTSDGTPMDVFAVRAGLLLCAGIGAVAITCLSEIPGIADEDLRKAYSILLKRSLTSFGAVFAGCGLAASLPPLRSRRLTFGEWLLLLQSLAWLGYAIWAMHDGIGAVVDAGLGKR